MATTKKITKALPHGFGTLTNKPEKYQNHPFFVRKAEEAKETLRLVGFPASVKRKLD